MASSTQKKSTTQKKSSGSKSTASRSAASKGGTAKKKAPPQPQKRPIRREVGGLVFLLLTLCVTVSYFRVSAIFIDLFAKLLKGLFGYGYWLAALAFLQAGLLLLFHRGRPVTLRVKARLAEVVWMVQVDLEVEGD